MAQGSQGSKGSEGLSNVLLHASDIIPEKQEVEISGKLRPPLEKGGIKGG